MTEPHEIPDPQALVDGKLRLESQAALTTKGATDALDEQSQQQVVVALEEKSGERQLSKLGSIAYSHLVPVLEVIERDRDWLVVSRKLTPAQRLSDKVSQQGPVPAVEAIRMTLRLVEALEKLHDQGLSHGRVHPSNVLVGLEDTRDPSLLFGTRCLAPYQRPERLDPKEPLSPKDDFWATTALLFFMLTGRDVPAEGLVSTAALDDRNITDELLREVLFHGLACDPAQRLKTLFAQKRELARWFVAHAAEEFSTGPMSHTMGSHKPPPLPPSLLPTARASLRSGEPDAGVLGSPASIRSQRSIKPQKRAWLRSVPLAVLAAVLGVGAAWGIAALRKSEPTVVVKDKLVPVAAAVASGPVDLAEVPVTGKEQEAGDATTSCVKGYIREGTLVKGANLDPLCHAGELPRALGVLRTAFASTAGVGGATLPRFDTLGWYALPVLSGLRQACCGESPSAIVWPDVTEACPDFVPSLETLGKAIGSNQLMDGSISRFDAAAKCATKTGRATGIAPAPPSPLSEKAFRELFAPSQPAGDPSAAPGSGDGSPAPQPSRPAP